MAMIPPTFDLQQQTTQSLAALVDSPRPVIILLPVGSVEPHGPHLSLVTDNVISETACARAAMMLDGDGYAPLVAPTIPYGVTNCATGFSGAVSVEAAVLSAYIRNVVDGYLGNGVTHVCVVNNHLEPEHDAAVRSAVAGIDRASVACPLEKRWARTLSDEFKSGACHAGTYESSIIMSARSDLVRDDIRANLPDVPISLSEKLREGVQRFDDMGLAQAYAGAPAKATAAHGTEQIEKLAEMIRTTVVERTPAE